MDTYNKLKQKNIRVKEIPKWGPYLRKLWEENFVSNLSEDEKESIHLFDDKDGASGFLWHVFSYEKKSYLEKN